MTQKTRDMTQFPRTMTQKPRGLTQFPREMTQNPRDGICGCRWMICQRERSLERRHADAFLGISHRVFRSRSDPQMMPGRKGRSMRMDACLLHAEQPCFRKIREKCAVRLPREAEETNMMITTDVHHVAVARIRHRCPTKGGN